MKPQITPDTIIVGIPYLDSGAQGRELEYALAGWHKHFKEQNYLVAVVGDHHPIVDCYERTFHILAPRVAPIEGEYLPALDIINKMQTLHRTFPRQKGFVWAADDIYAVNNFDLADIKFLKMLEPDITFSKSDNNPWRVMMAKTRTQLIKEGHPSRNFALHLPCWYEWDKLSALIEKYDMTHHSLSIQSMYFNTYFGDRVPFQLNAESDNIKCGIYKSRPRVEDLQAMFRKKIWINNSTIGFVAPLKKELEKHYGI